jgi:ornithine cyclodeaminase/alanine dehydrogenase-like protein (mu-crystallin family)
MAHSSISCSTHECDLPTEDLARAVSMSDVCVTCTPSHAPFLLREQLRPGAFVAAVGAEGPDKQELDPSILSSATVVVDVLDQCATIGELHHALEARLMTREGVHAELGEIVAGRKPGRRSDDETMVLDMGRNLAVSGVLAAETGRKLGGRWLDRRKLPHGVEQLLPLEGLE